MSEPARSVRAGGKAGAGTPRTADALIECALAQNRQPADEIAKVDDAIVILIVKVKDAGTHGQRGRWGWVGMASAPVDDEIALEAERPEALFKRVAVDGAGGIRAGRCQQLKLLKEGFNLDAIKVRTALQFGERRAA